MIFSRRDYMENYVSPFLVYLTRLIALAVIGLIIFFVIRLLKKYSNAKKKALVISFVCFFTVAVSWVLNMGWYRFGLIVAYFFIPIIGTGMFFVTNVAAAGCFEHSRRIRVLNLLFIITYLAGNLLFPDGGDIGEMYFFFGSIYSDDLANMAFVASGIAFLVHIILFIWQIIEVCRVTVSLKKQTQQAAEETDNPN